MAKPHLYITAGVLLVAFALTLVVVITPRVFRSSLEFPTLHITSALHPFEQERNTWHGGTLSLSNHAHSFEEVAVRLRGRGNSTWFQADDKLPLRLRFEEPQSLLGTDYTARDWVLIANHFDLTLMRTHLSFYLSSLLDGIDWTPFSHFAHLYINGEYMGLYQVADERDIIPGRMRLVFDEDPTLSEYLFELDNNSLHFGIEGETFFVATATHTTYATHAGNSLVLDICNICKHMWSMCLTLCVPATLRK